MAAKESEVEKSCIFYHRGTEFQNLRLGKVTVKIIWSILHVIFKSLEQYPGRFSLCLSISGDETSTMDQDPGVFSLGKTLIRYSVVFMYQSAHSLHTLFKIETPVLSALLMFSFMRISLSLMTSVCALHGLFPSLYFWSSFSLGMTLCIRHEDLEKNVLIYYVKPINMLKQPHVTLPLNLVMHLALPSQQWQDASKIPLSTTPTTQGWQAVSSEPPK